MNDSKWELSRLDNGELSALRRSAGVPVNRAGMAALRAFYKACGYCDPRLEGFWFPATCMDALWRNTEGIAEKPMKECLRGLLAADENATQSLQHRIDMLLEMTWDEDGYLLGKLLNMVKLIKSKTNLKPNFQDLADDLRYWRNDPNRRVQRDWLRTLYNVRTEQPNEEETQNVD